MNLFQRLHAWFHRGEKPDKSYSLDVVGMGRLLRERNDRRLEWARFDAGMTNGSLPEQPNGYVDFKPLPRQEEFYGDTLWMLWDSVDWAGFGTARHRALVRSWGESWREVLLERSGMTHHERASMRYMFAREGGFRTLNDRIFAPRLYGFSAYEKMCKPNTGKVEFKSVDPPTIRGAKPTLIHSDEIDLADL